jgi:two-component system, OmpR family, sensor histidine kinase ChvG
VPGQKARDEIGALSRSVGDLLRRLRDYTEYLRSLKGKLAHELRTPLAVVSTSLDNIAREQPPASLTPYLGRIREGAERLDALINAMSEATAIEQAVTDTARLRFDLAEVISSCVFAYRDVHAKRRFRLEGNGYSGSSAIAGAGAGAGAGTMISGSPDLIAQMMDKLIDNAVSFSPDDSEIVVELKHEGGLVELAVTNEGPPLPKHMKGLLFDSLVSVRDHDGRSNRHLGLGLYIVALIVRFHGGTVSATNRDDDNGVTIRAQFPATAHGTSPASKSRG